MLHGRGLPNSREPCMPPHVGLEEAPAASAELEEASLPSSTCNQAADVAKLATEGSLLQRHCSTLEQDLRQAQQESAAVQVGQQDEWKGCAIEAAALVRRNPLGSQQKHINAL